MVSVINSKHQVLVSGFFQELPFCNPGIYIYYIQGEVIAEAEIQYFSASNHLNYPQSRQKTFFVMNNGYQPLLSQEEKLTLAIFVAVVVIVAKVVARFYISSWVHL